MTHADTGTTVPIQRYEVPRYWARDLHGERVVVEYADHLTAMQQQREAALREALAAVEALPSVLNCWDRYGFHIEKNDATAVLQRLIDGGNE